MRTGIVVRKSPHVSTGAIAALRGFGVATIHEAMGRSGLMKPYMRPIFAGARIAGSAVTVLTHPGDNLMIHVAVEHCQPGDVLVVSVSADNTDGMFGELLAISATSRKVCGLVIDAGCRDVAGLTEMKFPVWSRAVSAKGAIKATLGSVNIPVVCAGAAVRAGDAVVADDDGVVVVPHADVARVLDAARQRVIKEDAKRKRLAAGELGLDIDNMRPRLGELGLQYFETLEDANL